MQRLHRQAVNSGDTSSTRSLSYFINHSRRWVFSIGTFSCCELQVGSGQNFYFVCMLPGPPPSPPGNSSILVVLMSFLWIHGVSGGACICISDQVLLIHINGGGFRKLELVRYLVYSEIEAASEPLGMGSQVHWCRDWKLEYYCINWEGWYCPKPMLWIRCWNFAGLVLIPMAGADVLPSTTSSIIPNIMFLCKTIYNGSNLLWSDCWFDVFHELASPTMCN